MHKTQNIVSEETQVVVVVGAGGLLGKQISELLLSHNFKVVLADINSNVLAEFVTKHVSYEANMFITKLDLTNEMSIKQVIEASLRKFGRIDAVVNTAYPRGNNYGRPLKEVTYESFCENLDLHLGGYFLVTKIFSEFFATQNNGHVLNLASVYGIVPPRFEIYEGTEMTMPVEYSAIKSGIISLSRYFTKMYLHEGVRFNCVAPGGVFDNQPDIFVKNYSKYAGSVGMVSPTQVSEVVAFLLSKSASAINGQTIVVDDAWSL